MAITYIGSDTDGFVATANSVLYILRSGFVLSNTGRAFDFAGFIGVDLVVEGSIYTETDGIGASSASNTASVFVSETGVIYAESDGIEINGTSIVIINDGEVYGGDDRGIQVASGAGGIIANNGNVFGWDDAIEFSGTDGRISNTGIATGHFDGLSMVSPNGYVFNSGTVEGGANGVDLAAPEGEVTTLRNTGTISGAVFAVRGGNANDNVINIGLLAGDVSLRIGNDRYNGTGGVVVGTVLGGEGNDTLLGGAGIDVLDGGEGNDRIEGGGGDDSLSGVAGHDLILGGAGNDTLSGHTGNDTLRGGEGDDVLYAGHHRDLLFGGAGTDSFVFTDVAESENSANADVIRDWDDDIIDLEAVSAQEMGFTGAAGHTGGGTASVRVVVNALGTAAVLVDADGNGTSDMRILVLGMPGGLTVEDFVL